MCAYLEFKSVYSSKVGASTILVFVFMTNEVYNRRITNDMLKRMMYNLVDIRWVLSSYSSVEGGIDG